MKTKLILGYILFSTNAFSLDCGIFQVNGVVRSTADGPIIQVHEKTQSEITIKVPLINEAVLAPYVDMPVAATVHVDKRPVGNSVLAVVKEIKSRIPNPLQPKDTSMTSIAKGECVQ